jgi:hypothetical protein
MGPGFVRGKEDGRKSSGDIMLKRTRREVEVFRLIGKLIRMTIILGIIAMVFNKVLKPRMSGIEEDSL